jgi:primosomal protein N' (replication factor Y)
VAAAAKVFAEALKTEFGVYMIGPAEPVVNRVRNQYLMELLFKLPKDTALNNRCKAAIHDEIALLHNEKNFKNVVMIADVDAM